MKTFSHKKHQTTYLNTDHDLLDIAHLDSAQVADRGLKEEYRCHERIPLNRETENIIIQKVQPRNIETKLQIGIFIDAEQPRNPQIRHQTRKPPKRPNPQRRQTREFDVQTKRQTVHQNEHIRIVHRLIVLMTAHRS